MTLRDTDKDWGLWIQWEFCWPKTWNRKKFCYILYRKTLSGDTLTFSNSNAQGGTLVTEFLEVKSFFFVTNREPRNYRLLLKKTFSDDEESSDYSNLHDKFPTKERRSHKTHRHYRRSHKTHSQEETYRTHKDNWRSQILRLSSVLLSVMLWRSHRFIKTDVALSEAMKISEFELWIVAMKISDYHVKRTFYKGMFLAMKIAEFLSFWRKLKLEVFESFLEVFEENIAWSKENS